MKNAPSECEGALFFFINTFLRARSLFFPNTKTQDDKNCEDLYESGSSYFFASFFSLWKNKERKKNMKTKKLNEKKETPSAKNHLLFFSINHHFPRPSPSPPGLSWRGRRRAWRSRPRCRT